MGAALCVVERNPDDLIRRLAQHKKQEMTLMSSKNTRIPEETGHSLVSKFYGNSGAVQPADMSSLWTEGGQNFPFMRCGAHCLNGHTPIYPLKNY